MGDPRYPDGGPAGLGLDRSLELAFRSPFFRRKLESGGIEPGKPVDWSAWRSIPPTTKEELRNLERFDEELVIASRDEIAEFWRSGGVTGKPLFYARTHEDVEHSHFAFGAAPELAGVTRSDTFMCSLPIGVHPAGQMLVRGAERLGAATVWTGAGNQTPSAAQIDLVHALGVTVWAGMASFGLHLAHLAEAAGKPLSESAVRLVMTTAEMLSPSKRALLEKLWGAEVRDVFGMSEITLMGGECGRSRGHHIWPDTSFCEILNPDTMEPVVAGEVGVMCVTPVAGNTAIPFIRWLSGDVVRMEWGCDCARKDDPRIIHSGRTLSFFKVKGVNVNHAEAEDALYGVPDLKDFRVTFTAEERLLVEVETADGKGDAVSKDVDQLFRNTFGVAVDVSVLERGTIARSVEGQIKAQRFIDQRKT